jgi:anaerobic selenocysteine-containing dehydrogenase
MAQNPVVAMVDEIEAGNIRALFVAGGNPLLSFPQPARLEKALRSLDLLVVFDILETSFTRLATDVMAVSGQFERSDILVESFTTLLSAGIVEPMGVRRPIWWILSQLARRMGADLLNGRNPDEVTEEDVLRDFARNGRDGPDALFAAGTDGLVAPPMHGWVREKVLPSGCWRLVPPGLAERLPTICDDALTRGRGADELMLVSGRQLTRVNATSYVPVRKNRDFPLLHVHPADAEKRQVHDGDSVSVLSSTGRLQATVAVDDTVRKGVVWLPHGCPEANPGQLTSGECRLDPMTGQPEMTAIVVTLERAQALEAKLIQ